jgi:Major capsid protein Gp23
MSNLQSKWQAILEHPEAAPIKDAYRKQVTAVLLENQEKALAESRKLITESGTPANVAGNVDKFDPILIALVRRAMPNLMAYDICGVQPMNMPTGLIFAMKSKYGSGATGPLSSTEALFNEADTDFSGTGTHTADIFSASNTLNGFGTGLATANGEGFSPLNMGFSIEKVTVTAKTRALKAEYSLELAQDLKAMHNLDAESELSNILSTEIMAEINREVIRTLYNIAKSGAASGTTTAGYFDLDTDSDGRWSVERFKGLMFHAEREANTIAKATRRGKGNIIICSSDVASALAMAGKLDYTPALSTDLNVDDTGNTFAGVLNGKYKVYVDPYFSVASGAAFSDVMVVGYKGSNAYDAGLFYCPYVPLQMVRAVDPDTFQPKIGFKTRYGMVANPLSGDGITLGAASNDYYRLVKIKNIL